MAGDKKAPEENPLEAYAKTVNAAILGNAHDIVRLKHKFSALKKLLEAERVPPEIIKLRLQARGDVIMRAKDIWGQDYAESSDGLYPHGMQIGRRYIIPQDFGFKSWEFEKPDERSKEPSPEVLETEAKKLGQHRLIEWRATNDEVFLILHGFKYKPLDGDEPKLQSLCHQWCGITMPVVSMSISVSNARMIGGYYTMNLEHPATLSPRSALEMKAFFNDLGPHKYRLCIFGEAVGKRRYLFTEPQDLMSGVH